LGIAVGGFTSGQNLNFAIPSKFIIELINSQKELTPLDIPTKKQLSSQTKSSKDVKTDLRDAIKVRNLIWGHDELRAKGFPDEFFKDPNYLYELSILNNLSYPVSDILLFFIIYDRSGTPVDYSTLILPPHNELILPGLAKSFTALSDLLDPSSLRLDKKLGYKCEVRILDFTIHYDK
jgi:hypothetical protein